MKIWGQGKQERRSPDVIRVRASVRGSLRSFWSARFLILAGLIPVALVLPRRSQANERPILNVLVPLQTLQADLVSSFEKSSGASVRIGFLGLSSDTDSKVRQDSTVWDVVVSDELQLRRLGRLDRLSRLEADRAAHSLGAETRETAGKPYVLYAPLFVDPIGLSCKLPGPPKGSRPLPVLRWKDLSHSLIEAGLLGEVVLGVPVLSQAVLANALVGVKSEATGSSRESRPLGEERVVFPEPPARGDERVVWLNKLHWQTRPPRGSLDAEILSDRVSCVLTHLSVHRGLQQYFLAGRRPSPRSLVFLIPDGKTVVQRLAVSVTEETAKQKLALQFVDLLVAQKAKIAERNGLCPDVYPVVPSGSLSPSCQFEALDVLAELPTVPERMLKMLQASYLRKSEGRVSN